MDQSGRPRRWYRWLLHANRGWYRRAHGREMLTTVPDAAGPGQRHLRWRKVIGLMGAGPQRRLHIGGPGGVVLGVLTALVAGLAGAAVAGRVTSFSSPPTTAHAVAVAGVAVAAPPHDLPGPVVTCDYWCPDWDGRDGVVAYDGPVDRTDFVRIGYDPPPDDREALLEGARERLAAAGWQVKSRGASTYGVADFEASRDGTTVVVHSGYGDTEPPVSLSVTKGLSTAVVVAVATGLLAGGLVGWLAAAWTVQRYRRHRPAVRTLMLVAGFPALLAAMVMATAVIMFAVALTRDHGWSPKDLLLPMFLLTAFPPLTLTMAGAAVLAVALAAVPLPAAPTIGDARPAR